MLIHPTLEKLQQLRLTGMAKALEEQLQMTGLEELGFAERLGLLVDRELTERENRKLKARLDKARLRQAAVVEDVDLRTPRGLDRSVFLSLCSCDWIRQHLNVLITGPTGTGKSFLACALAHKACREGFSALYYRLPRLLPDLALAKADGRYGKLLSTLARADLLVLDDWGLQPLTDGHRRDLLEILEDRYGSRSTLVTSQLPVDTWHDAIGDATLADAVLDRLVHNAYRLALKAKESMRKTKALQLQSESPS
ncbi:MAG TPA: IS21-like element helper ATPase IstB [Roseiflexaceae bacterium]|nr:IS21-like element helper ATPase IstB [Roseiflexaceae bacterium]